MITIDIAQRAAARAELPAVSFRRTDADRRPARRVVMPNDGPAPDREAQAAARREALRRKYTQPHRDPGMTRSEGFERSVRLTMQAMAKGKSILPEIAPELGVCTDRARDFCIDAVSRGLATMRKELRDKGRTFAAYYLTDEGRAYLTGGGDGQG